MTCCRINRGQSNFAFENLGKFKIKFEKALGYASGTSMGEINEKH
jgi:hypothetical protein